MNYPQLSHQIIELKEERSKLYLELSALKNQINAFGEKRQSAPGHLVTSRDQAAERITGLTLQIDRLQQEKLELVHDQTEREKYHGSIRKIACALIMDPHRAASQETIVAEAVQLEAAIRKTAVPQS
jgi:chromosome segregation ATPase